MYFVYVLYSPSSNKTYTGFSNDVDRRLFEHNVSETKGFTLRYRPWILIHSESFELKMEAMKREKFFKTGQGRELLKVIVSEYLNRVRYPPQAEKD
jgi:putative endonuclease